MTYVNGVVHYGIVARNLVRPEIWEKQHNIDMSILPPVVAAMIERTEVPFVTRIYNVTSTKGGVLRQEVDSSWRCRWYLSNTFR